MVWMDELQKVVGCCLHLTPLHNFLDHASCYTAWSEECDSREHGSMWQWQWQWWWQWQWLWVWLWLQWSLRCSPLLGALHELWSCCQSACWPTCQRICCSRPQFVGICCLLIWSDFRGVSVNLHKMVTWCNYSFLVSFMIGRVTSNEIKNNHYLIVGIGSTWEDNKAIELCIGKKRQRVPMFVMLQRWCGRQYLWFF